MLTVDPLLHQMSLTLSFKNKIPIFIHIFLIFAFNSEPVRLIKC